MKVLLDINDNKAAFFLEMLKNFTFVKTTKLTPIKADILEGIKNAVDEVNQIKNGKKDSKSLSEFLDEL